MTEKKLNKKLIVTTNFYGMTDGQFISKTSTMAKEAGDNPSYVPGLNPTPGDVLTVIDDLKTLLKKRADLKQQQKALTKNIRAKKDKITDIFTSKWTPQVQLAVGDDLGKLSKLGFGAKGLFDGHSEDAGAKAANTSPLIVAIDTNKSMIHTLRIVNSKSGRAKLPPDARRIDIYMSIGDTEPVDFHKLQYMGSAKRGKKTIHFEPEDIDKTVYYIAVYVDKKTDKPISQSMPKKSKIIVHD